MTELANPVYLSPVRQAEALAYALAKFGYSAEVWKSRDYQIHPCVVVRCGPKIHLRQTEYVFAGPRDGDDEWWFYRANPQDVTVLEQIAPISQVSNAAGLLKRTLPQLPPDSGDDNT